MHTICSPRLCTYNIGYICPRHSNIGKSVNWTFSLPFIDCRTQNKKARLWFRRFQFLSQVLEIRKKTLGCPKISKEKQRQAKHWILGLGSASMKPVRRTCPSHAQGCHRKRSGAATGISRPRRFALHLNCQVGHLFAGGTEHRVPSIWTPLSMAFTRGKRAGMFCINNAALPAVAP